MTVGYPAVTVTGGMLPGALLQRIGDGEAGLPGADPASYGLQAGESVRRYANRAFAYLTEQWREYAKQRARAADPASARLTRERWLLVLLRELGFEGIQALPGGITVDDKTFAVSHQWQQVPVHLLGWGVDLDHRTPGLRGAAGAAPHSLVQQLLNRSHDHLWAVLSNGVRLRLLRDSATLVGSAYIDFDLEAIFDGELFPDFVVLYRTAHASRFAIRDPETGPASCHLEAWRSVGAAQGERALDQLRVGVQQTIEILGTGLLDHPANPHLRTRIDTELSTEDFKRSLLRLVYRLLFWFVTEDRDVLLDPDADPAARQRYDTFFSARRLRDLALRRRHSRHGDLWEQTRLVFDVLGCEDGWAQLGLPGIGGLFEDGPLDEPLHGARLTNTALLQAVEALAVLSGKAGTGRQRVDFRHLGAEELGSVYESLLELHPRWDPAARRFHLERLAAGSERKSTGSYYTPTSLVECLLDSALDPLLDEASARPTPAERIEALLNLTVCDPACGSGHFLIAAARRIAKRVAAEETDELEPTPAAVRHALRRVVGQCIYGVDVNEMAAELAKVSLWLEAMEPGRPLSYLDTNIRVGNSLLGVTPRLLADGIPDAAYTPLDGDENKVAAQLKKQNAAEKSGQGDLFSTGSIPVTNTTIAAEADAIVHTEPRSLADVHVQARRALALEGSEERRRAKLVADAWCAAFVQDKTQKTRGYAVTHRTLERFTAGESTLDVAEAEAAVEELVRQYRFFHWHIEFPHIFRVPEYGGGDRATGWDGGFRCVLGNPPWDRVKLQEQEFFAARDETIVNAPNASARKKLIAALETSDEPGQRALHGAFLGARREADGVSHLLRSAGRYPLTGRGDLNTYAVFAETARTLLHPRGQLGVIVPTGIATDATTQDFFRDLVEHRRLVSVLDFVTNPQLWTDVGHRRFRFVILVVTGLRRTTDLTEFATLTKHPSQLPPKGGRITLPVDDILTVNPNTGTCPMFGSRRDADITVGIYRRTPVLWRDNDANGNPWGLSFMAMLHMANDSSSFRTAEQLSADGWKLDGNVFVRGEERMLPLYEAKLVHYYDHRLSCYSKRPKESQDTELPRLTEAEKLDPHRSPIPRYWVAESEVEKCLGERWPHGWLLGWRDICRSTDERTLIATVLPRTAVGHTYPIALTSRPVHSASLQANLSTFALDFVVRQKLSGTHLTYTYLKQLPVLPPERYDEAVPWDSTVDNLDRWVAARVLELSYTSYDTELYARDLGDDGPPFRWDPARREMMRAELDAAYFHLYGVERDDVEYIMDTFKVVREKDEAKHGEYRTKRLILERYDAMATATRTGVPYQTPLDQPPGQGPRHPVAG